MRIAVNAGSLKIKRLQTFKQLQNFILNITFLFFFDKEITSTDLPQNVTSYCNNATTNDSD